jgi:outer membrane receptor for ferrienterochelin and colicins
MCNFYDCFSWSWRKRLYLNVSFNLLLYWICFTITPAAAAKHYEDMSLDELSNIVIMGASKYEQKQKEVAAAVRVITRNDIRAYGWRTLTEILASLPGVHLTYDHAYEYLGTRGLGLPGDINTRILVTVNGNRINEATYDQGATGRDFPLDLDLIDRIEFIPGPGSAVYGQNAMLGVINIITRSGSDVDGIELTAAYQTAESMFQERATIGREFDNGVNALVSISGLQARGRDLFFGFGDSNLSGVARGMDGENIKQVFAKLTRGSFSFDFIFGDRKKEDPTASFFSDPLTPGQWQRDRRLHTQIQFSDTFAKDTLSVLGRLFLGHYHWEGPWYFDGQKTFSTGPSDWHGAEVRLLSSALSNHRLMAGAEYHNNTRIKQTFLNFENPEENLSINSSVLRMGVYIQDEWRINDTISSTLGLRYDYNGWIGGRLSPRAALIWRAAPEATVRALYGRAHRAPNSYERDYQDEVTQVANSGLRSEAIDTLEIVADYQPQSNMNIRANVYAWNLRNVIQLGIDPDSELLQFQQIPEKVLARGAELSLDKTWGKGARLFTSYGIQSVQQQGSQVLNSPHHLAKLNVLVPIPLMTGLRAGYELQFYGKRKTLEGTYTKSYLLSNLNLVTDIRWVKGLNASLAFYNLFNKNYEHPASDINWQNSLPQLGRTVRFRLDYRF